MFDKDSYIETHSKEEFLQDLDEIQDENPMLMQLAFSLLKLHELDILTKEEMNRYLRMLEEKRELL